MIDLLVIMLFMLYALPVLALAARLIWGFAPAYFPYAIRFISIYSMVLITLMVYCFNTNPAISPY